MGNSSLHFLILHYRLVSLHYQGLVNYNQYNSTFSYQINFLIDKYQHIHISSLDVIFKGWFGDVNIIHELIILPFGYKYVILLDIVFRFLNKIYQLYVNLFILPEYPKLFMEFDVLHIFLSLYMEFHYIIHFL